MVPIDQEIGIKEDESIKSVRLKRGVSLGEVVVSMFVIMLFSLGISSCLVAATKNTRQSEVRGMIAKIALQQLEELRGRSFTNLSPISNASFSIPPQATAQLSNVHDVRGSYSIEAVTGRANLKQIVVVIRWRNASVTTSADAPYSDYVVSTLRARGTEPGELQ